MKSAYEVASDLAFHCDHTEYSKDICFECVEKGITEFAEERVKEAKERVRHLEDVIRRIIVIAVPDSDCAEKVNVEVRTIVAEWNELVENRAKAQVQQVIDGYSDALARREARNAALDEAAYVLEQKALTNWGTLKSPKVLLNDMADEIRALKK